MKNPGKIALILLFAASLMHAGVTAQVDHSSVVLGERVVLNLNISGDDFEEPVLDKICGSDILSTSRSTNMQIINGSYSKTQMISYTFMPTASCTIDPIAVKVDGKYESSDALKVTVKPAGALKDAPFILTMESEKPSVYVGEPFKVTITLKQRHNAEAVDSKFAPPELKNFWIKEQQQGRRFEEGDYSVTKVVYVVAAQKSGPQQIGRAQLQVATRSHSRDAWGQWFPQLQWRSFFSNELSLDVKALPQGVNLVGDFAITAELDKKEVNAGEPVNLTLKISGKGNFEDIGSLKPSIPNVNIFEEDATTKGYIEQDVYRGTWQQKMAFVADGDFTIPPIELRYFDTASEQIKTVKTGALHVTVRGGGMKKAQQELKISRASDNEKADHEASAPVAGMSKMAVAAATAGGFLGGILIMLLPWRRLRLGRAKEGSERVSSSDHRAALAALMRHLDDPEAAAMVGKLEANLYEGAGETIDKKALKALLKRYGR